MGNGYQRVPGSSPDNDYEVVTRRFISDAALFIQQLSLNEGESRSAFCDVGDAAAVPNTDLSGITSADIIEWDGFVETTSKSLNLVCAVDKLAGNNHLGWWVTVNAGSAVIAKQRLRETFDTAAGIEVARYVAAATVDADENKGSVLVGPGLDLTIVSNDPILDVYVMPIAQAAVAVGTSVFMAVLS